MKSPRRNFLDTSFDVMVALMIGGVAAKLARIGSEVEPYSVTTSEGTFVMLVGTHGIGEIGQTIKKSSIEGNREIDAAFFETGDFGYFRKGTRDFSLPLNLEKTSFYREIIPYFRNNGIKMLFGDVPFPDNMATIAAVEGINTVATFGGLALAFGGDEPKFTRREFLRRSVGELLALWGTLRYTKKLTETFVELYRQPWSNELRQAGLLTEVIHPEDVITALRNALIAEKLLNYSQQISYEEGRKPTIAVLGGVGHEFITEYLKRGRDFCRGVLDYYPETVLRTIYGENFENYYAALAEVKTTQGWQVSRVIIDGALENRTRGKESIFPSTRELKG